MHRLIHSRHAADGTLIPFDERHAKLRPSVWSPWARELTAVAADLIRARLDVRHYGTTLTREDDADFIAHLADEFDRIMGEHLDAIQRAKMDARRDSSAAREAATYLARARTESDASRRMMARRDAAFVGMTLGELVEAGYFAPDTWEAA